MFSEIDKIVDDLIKEYPDNLKQRIKIDMIILYGKIKKTIDEKTYKNLDAYMQMLKKQSS